MSNITPDSVARQMLDRVLDSDFATHPEYLVTLREGISHRQAVNEENYIVAIDTDLSKLPSVNEFGGRGGCVYVGGHHFIFECDEHRTVMRCRPQHLRVLIDREGVQDEDDFSLTNTVVEDALGKRSLVEIKIKHQKGTGTPQAFCIKHDKFRDVIETAMKLYP
jgi:hypothetical protein